jgi:hypothetical protein
MPMPCYWWDANPPRVFAPGRWRCGAVKGRVPARPGAGPGEVAFAIARCPLSDVLCGCRKAMCPLGVAGRYESVPWRVWIGGREITTN